MSKSNSKSNSKSGGGISFGFLNLLTVLFIALKLCKVITWSWWWVLSPLWISVIIFIIVMALILIPIILIAIKDGTSDDLSSTSEVTPSLKAGSDTFDSDKNNITHSLEELSDISNENAASN